MKTIITKFARHEDGDVTVDWVVLTAAIVALGVAAAAAMTSSTTSLSDDIWRYMDSITVF
jgi:hypothetical protein